ncbi:signal recognition particle-docking protein FtsY [Mailhella massiliensis]|uniref:signal recognition particle-docking protein FtsY n=1 Tax=Mailhella massiliensis TaxID=1903261 RepID=UPI00097DDC36|nr:signal recognition particle-docking protein FtsY [Mailhella massiliensis]
MGFFSAVKRFFSGGSQPAEEVKQKEAPEESPKDEGTGPAGETPEEPADSEPVQPAPEAEEAGQPEVEEKAPEDEEAAPAAEAPAEEAQAEAAEEALPEASPREEEPAEEPLAAPEEEVREEVQDKAPQNASLPQEEMLPAAESGEEKGEEPAASPAFARSPEEEALALALRQAEPRLSAWLAVVLDGVEEEGDLLWSRLSFLLRALETPEDEARLFLDDFRNWLERMEYHWLEDFRSELQYRLALALDMEDEEDERDRLFAKLQSGLERTRARFGQGLAALMSGHSALDAAFWDEMEELFIMADMGAEPSLALVKRLKERAREGSVTTPEGLMPLLEEEVEAIFKAPRRIAAVNPPEVILMVGVNGVGKTTTIAKLAYRARMQGKKVLIAAADTFRAAAVEQLEEWAKRVGADFHAKGMGADPAAVAFEAMDKALKGGYDVIFIDTAGRLHTKSNLMDELHKIRMVVERKHPGAPHRTILVIDATTGQNALQQTKMFKDTSGVNEIILTKLDGTAKGGVALAVASQFELPITFIGLGEKMEDLRPFDAHDFARALLGRDEKRA